MSVRRTRRPSPPSTPGSLRSTAEPVFRTTQRSPHRVALVRAGIWAAVAAGPVALLVAVAAPAPSATPPPALPASTPGISREADPAGVAELFCDLWLRAGAGAGESTDSATVRAVRALAPDAALPEGLSQGEELLRTVAVRSAQVEGGNAWSVVVAAHFRSAAPGAESDGDSVSEVRYFAVPVTSSAVEGAGGFTVTGVPAQVAGPGKAKVAASPFGTLLPGQGALAVSLGEFFDAYLVGVGEVGRYLAPGADLSPVRGSNYRSVAVGEVRADSEVADGAVPADGTEVRVRAAVTAVDGGGGQWPLEYELSMRSRSGRWEVSGLRAGAAAPARSAVAGGAAK
ncbi:conjugal transfer protein [Streptomyces rubiginosohelvolus]|uniref:conjugal transfer protein n=1 Tax=Streptomyces rubiginosohelvolus TaxID=67362 RepID=UPI0035D6AF43